MKRMFEGLKKKIRTPQFVAISIHPNNIKEKVYLKESSSKLIDVSLVHSPFCLKPLIIGVKIEQGLIKNEKEFELIFLIGGKHDEKSIESIESNMAAKLFVSLRESVKLKDESILLLLKVKKTKLFQLNMIERKQLTFALYFYYLKKSNRHTINFLNNMCAVYSYPRKVVLTIVKTKSHFNIFPMDFVLHLPEEKVLLLGLNQNNRSLPEIFESKKLVVADVAPSEKNFVYSLADQHRKEVKDVKTLLFDFFNSDLLNFPVPEFALEYKEVGLIKNVKLGSHYLLVCKVVNEKEIKPEVLRLYHIHSIHHLHSIKNNFGYTTV